MIKAITLTNFFSFQAETIDFNAGANLFVGINGSGKSNLLKALTLVKIGVEGNQDDTALQDLIVSRYGGFDSVFCKSSRQGTYKDTIGLEFVFDKHLLSAYGHSFQEDIRYTIIIKRQADQGNYFVSEKIAVGDFVFLDFYNGKGKVSERTPKEGEGRQGIRLVRYDDYNPRELSLSKISEFDKDRYLPLVILKRALRDMNIYTYFDTTADSKLRKSMSATSATKQLLPDGTNLPQILNYIKINDKPAYRKIQERLQDVNPHFRTFDFNVLGGSGVFELMLDEDKLNTSIHVSHISDGTLRYLCLMAILYNPFRGRLICIDEPEVGLHPDMIYNVADAIKETSENSMVIVSTHSVDLLNYFDIEQVFVFEKDEDNTSVINRFTEAAFEGWYDTFMPGNMWKSGDLGGKRW